MNLILSVSHTVLVREDGVLETALAPLLEEVHSCPGSATDKQCDPRHSIFLVLVYKVRKIGYIKG